MISSAGVANKQSMVVKGLSIREPWEAFLLHVSAFPLPQPEDEAVLNFLQTFIREASRRWKLSLELFIQLEQFQNSEARRIFTRHAPGWVPEVGLGIWPDREPPTPWSREEFMAAIATHKRLRPLMFQVFQVTAPLPEKMEAQEALLRFGPLLEFLTADAESLLGRTNAALLPGIPNPSYNCFPFYVPLLEAKTLYTATPARLESWIGTNSIYIRESFEDQGILFVSRLPLSALFEDLSCGSNDHG